MLLNRMHRWHQCISLLITILCSCISAQTHTKCNRQRNETFEVIFQFDAVNFTWPTQEIYQNAVKSGHHDPHAYSFYGIQVYGNDIYLAFPRSSEKNAVTLASLPLNSEKFNPLFTPYPSWAENNLNGGNCTTLQNVLSLQIDRQGIMWVLDGNREYNPNGCPAKIVLYDLKNNGKMVQTYVMPEWISSKVKGWLNDLVIDESDGGFAYIAESSDEDPGLIVYSKSNNTAWKFRDRSMFAEVQAAGFSVHGVRLDPLFPVQGVALSPFTSSSNARHRVLFYSAMTAYTIYSLQTEILKNEMSVHSSEWRKSVRNMGKKCSPSNGMIMDNMGNLYFGMIPQDSIGRWNIYRTPLERHEQTVYTNHTTIDSPDMFAMDDHGNLYVTSTGHEIFFNPNPDAKPAPLRILRRHIGTKSYLYPKPSM